MSDLRAWWPIEGRDELRDELEAAYADPVRGYHDTLHLTDVLTRLDARLDTSVQVDRGHQRVRVAEPLTHLGQVHTLGVPHPP